MYKSVAASCHPLVAAPKMCRVAAAASAFRRLLAAIAIMPIINSDRGDQGDNATESI